MFEASGFLVVYLYSNHMCQDIKLYIVGAWLVLSVVLVLAVEVRIRIKKGVTGYTHVVNEDD